MKNILDIVKFVSIICFCGCFFILGKSYSTLNEIYIYSDFYTNRDDYKCYNVEFNGIDSLNLNGSEWATTNFELLKGLDIHLNVNWRKYLVYTEQRNELGDFLIKDSLLLPIWVHSKYKTAFCNFDIKDSLLDYINYLRAKNPFFDWWCIMFCVFIISFLTYVFGNIINGSLSFSEMSIFYISLLIIWVPVSFFTIGTSLIFPFTGLVDKYLNSDKYQKKYIKIDRYEILASYNGKGKNEEFVGYNGVCYSNELKNISIEVIDNKIIIDNFLGEESQKEQLLVWYNPQTHKAFLANDHFPLISYKQYLQMKISELKFCYGVLFFLVFQIIMMKIHYKTEQKRNEKISQKWSDYSKKKQNG